MKYKFARLENESIKKFEFDTLEELKSWINQELENYKKINKVTDESKDKSFLNYKANLERYAEG